MKLRRAIVARVLLVVLVAGSLLAVASGPASAKPAGTADVGTADVLTGRQCTNIPTGDRLRMLSVCTRGWYDGVGTSAVVEMHTYKWASACPNAVGNAVTSGCWVDSTSQSITMNQSLFEHYPPSGSSLTWWWGNDMDWEHKCYVDSPSGTKACSVANRVRVAYYSSWFFDDHCGNPYNNTVYRVSWRDDRGVAHYRDNLLLAVSWVT